MNTILSHTEHTQLYSGARDQGSCASSIWCFWCRTSSFLKNLFVRPHVNDKRESVLKKSASWTFFENLSLCWLCCSKGAPFICGVKRRKTLRFKKIPGWHVDEVLETTSVDRGRPHSFSQVYIIRVCVPRTGFDLLASGISFALSLSKLHFRLPVFVEKEANIGC